MRPGATIAMILLALIALLHVIRVIMGVPLVVGTTAIPMWASILGTIVTGTVAVLLWREGQPGR